MAENMTRSAEGKPGKKVREAWDGDRPEPAAARERLLEVAALCIARNGIPATGIPYRNTREALDEFLERMRSHDTPEAAGGP